MRRKLVAGNWKMHGTQYFVRETLQALRDASDGLQNVDMAICPALVHVPLAAEVLAGSVVALGAQNVHHEAEGAFTGEVAAPMLAEYGVRYVIVGHSERRQFNGETDQLVAKKFVAVQAAGMVPILCVGESLVQREKGTTGQVVVAQLDGVLEVAGIGAFADAVIAYEPIWAIGTGKTATPAQAQEVHALIRQRLREFDGEVAMRCRLLYGGSVNAGNAEQLFARPDIDGGLVGGASLKVDDFVAICKSVG
jgi:triosephosphate isomerase